MKLLTFCFLILAGCVVAAAEKPAQQPLTNHMVITAGSFDYETNVVVYQRDVRVTDAQMQLTCELLTLAFSAGRAGAAAGGATIPTNIQRIEVIMAETNVVMVQGENRVTGQKALYTATNELIVISGNPLVLVETPQGFLICSNLLYYDLRRNKLWGVGGILMSNKPGMTMFGSESLGLSLPGSKRPGRKAGGSAK